MRALAVGKRVWRDWANDYRLVVPNGAYLNEKRDRMSGSAAAEIVRLQGYGSF